MEQISTKCHRCPWATELTRSGSTITHSWIPHLRSQLSDVSDATAWHYVTWYATVEITPHSSASVVMRRMVHRNVWLDSAGSTFVVGSFWFSKMWTSYPISSSFVIQRLRWLDLKRWCYHLAVIMSAWPWIFMCTLQYFQAPTPALLSGLLLPERHQISRGNRAQSMRRNEGGGGGQQPSLKLRCHLMPGMPCDGFPNHLTYCIPSNA